MTDSHGAPERLYLLQLHAMVVSPHGRELALVLGCYLIQTSDGTNILVDSGLPAGYQQPGVPPPDPSRNVIECLADLDLHPDDIDFLVCTHFDVDHAGHHDAFVRAEFVVQRAHYEQARGGHPRYAAARPHWDQPALRYRLLEGDTEILPGIVLLETSGHALGHQSVLVRLPRTGPVLLAIDAVPMQRLFIPDRPAWPMDEDDELVRVSTQKLLDLVDREEVGMVIFGHDGDQWRTLKRAPEHYA